MKIQHLTTSTSGKFLIQNAQHIKIAEMSYRWKDENTIIADHTWVDNSLRGQGVAHLLLDQLVEFARHKHIKIIATCSYIEVIFKRKKEFSDVVA